MPCYSRNGEVRDHRLSKQSVLLDSHSHGLFLTLHVLFSHQSNRVFDPLSAGEHYCHVRALYNPASVLTAIMDLDLDF